MIEGIKYPWGHNRRYNTYAEYFKRKFGHRVQKLTLDAGFSCPNRDGTISTGGCSYCNNDAFNPSYCVTTKPINQQLEEGIEFHQVRYRTAKNYLAYFQAFSNTHAPLEVLKRKYEEALAYPGVIGLVIGTRPDCIDNEKLDYLAKLAEQYYITVEYGVESVYNDSLININRGHTFEQSVKALEETSSRGIYTGAHFIIGLPNETEDQIIESVKTISELPLSTIKFHQLQIVKDTTWAKEYLENKSKFKLFEQEDYLTLLAKMIERLNPAFVVERIAGEVPPWFLLAPDWGLVRVLDIVRAFEKKLDKLDTWQGKYYI